MSSSNAPTAKMQPTQKTETDLSQTSKTATNPPPAMLEEDDEFEDFPVEGTRRTFGAPLVGASSTIADSVRTDWAQEDTEVPGGTTHLWEESWDDDDENEDFSKQLKCVSSRSLGHVPQAMLTKSAERS
jgi:26 proteasome complex subunit DSS1